MGLLALCFLPSGAGHSRYQERIPNGRQVQRSGVYWPAVGHKSSSIGSGENEFGYAFKRAGYSWTVALCEADSDGDGYSNGMELGDPNCTWIFGQAPARSVNISHPGFADSLPSDEGGGFAASTSSSSRCDG
eukprot:CAMPEP_0176074954 /NCGR_PEP_ID=MMETSP0120_2-20121206/37461_1 /TAXON_ID=160619 /ORGANISM="Kryptoperidinium foliaceum, Strain CCMP 1326" /LENGTH=131 /DNA_ID=CAMNT_0017408655 /DNA_START=1 /DNA_END=392 /DNA_ORIENTATION=+